MPLPLALRQIGRLTVFTGQETGGEAVVTTPISRLMHRSHSALKSGAVIEVVFRFQHLPGR